MRQQKTTQVIGVRLDQETVEALDLMAKADKRSRAGMIAAIVERAVLSDIQDEARHMVKETRSPVKARNREILEAPAKETAYEKVDDWS